MAERKGLEPSASGVTGRRYNRLNYRSVTWPCFRAALLPGVTEPDKYAFGHAPVIDGGGAEGTRTLGLRRDRPAL